MNDDELRARLHGAVPEPPDAAAWAGRARTKAGHAARTRRATGAGMALAAVVTAALLWFPFGDQGRTAVPAQQPPATAPASPQGNPDCAAGLTGSPDLPERTTEQLARISLCPRADGPTFTTPTDALTTDPSALLAAIKSLPAEGTRDPDCSRSTDRRYLIVFTMADGARWVLEAATANACGVTKGSASERRWSGMLTLLRGAWERQRSLHSTAGAADRCLPFDQPGLFAPKLAEILTGAICRFDSESRLQVWITLPDDLLPVIRADLAANTSRADNIDSRSDGAVLTLDGPFGDPLVLWRVDGNQWFAFMPDGHQLFWQPGPDAEDVLTGLLNRITTPSPLPATTPPSTTGSGLPEGCRGLSPSRAPARVPTVASRLRLCPTGWYTDRAFAPLDTVDGARAGAVLRTLNGQRRLPSVPACRADLGPDFLLVAENDGQPPVVMVLQLYGCDVAGIVDTPHTGAREVLDEFRAQLDAQRRTGPAQPLERSGSLCRPRNEPATSVMPVEPSAVTGGRLCVYQGASDRASRELGLSPALAGRIAAVLVGRSPAAPASCPDGRVTRRLALTDRHGDVLLVTENCRSWSYVDGTEELRWRPPAAIAKELDALATS